MDETVDPQQGVQVWEDETEDSVDLWYFHPIHALTEATMGFSEELKYYNRFGGAPQFANASSRWWDAVATYDRWMTYWQTPRANKAGYS